MELIYLIPTLIIVFMAGWIAGGLVRYQISVWSLRQKLRKWVSLRRRKPRKKFVYKPKVKRPLD